MDGSGSAASSMRPRRRSSSTWLTELGAAPPPVRPLPIREVVPEAEVDGPAPELTDEVRALQVRFHAGRR